MCFFKKWAHYFRMSYFFHLLYNLCDLKSYGCTKLKKLLLLWASKAKDEKRKNHKEHECIKYSCVN
jgi:hypothetical protein